MSLSGPHNDITDVDGIAVGHHQRIGRGWLTGTTVVRCPAGTVGGVDIRGGAPGTRETDLLSPTTMMHRVDAIVLTGGSAFGLAAADGTVAWLAERNIGFRVGDEPHQVVPIVPGAVLFDLGRGGKFANRPDASFGRRAAAAARSIPAARGNVGAGTGAIAGGLKGGVGSASVVTPSGATVGALVVVNAAGSVVNAETGELLGIDAETRKRYRLRRPTRADIVEAQTAAALEAGPRPLNTTLAVIATDAELSKAECSKLAGAAQNGLVRAIHPVHTLTDGDIVFGLATGSIRLEPAQEPRWPGADPRLPLFNGLLAAAAVAMTRAVVDAIVSAESVADISSYLDRYRSARRS